VLAHEQAHLRCRHHLLVTMADALGAAYPMIAAFRLGREQVRVLAELSADDAASASGPAGGGRPRAWRGGAPGLRGAGLSSAQAGAAGANPVLDPGTSMGGTPAPDFRLVNQFGQH